MAPSPVPVSWLPVWILGSLETVDSVRAFPQIPPKIVSEDVVADVDEPPNLVLAGVFCREWCPAAVTVSGEAEGCEAEAPADVISKFLG